MPKVKVTKPKRAAHCATQARKVRRGVKKATLADAKCQKKGPVHG